MNSFLRRCVLLILLNTFALMPASASQRQEGETRAGTSKPTPSVLKTVAPLAVVGFRAAEELDDRDTWIPLAVEETLAWRLRRNRELTVIPTIRTHQARKELADGADDPPAEWARVLRLLGAKLWLTGTCSGTPDALIVDLELLHPDHPDAAQGHVRLGPGRLFEVIDESTRWALTRLNVARMDHATEQLVFGPPATSPSALEYYAKALAAARGENLRDAAYYVRKATDYDPSYRPALILSAKIGLRGSQAARARAEVHLRLFKRLAADCGDAVDEAEFELNQGLLLTAERSFDAAQQRFEASLASASERDDLYGQIAAMNSLCDFWCNRQPPTRAVLSEEERRRFGTERLRWAAEWQVLLMKALEQLGDVVAETPAANKLALIYEQLDEPKSALEMYKRTVAAATKTGSARNQATALLFLGQCHRRHERWHEALDATSRCLALAADEAKPAIRITLAEIYRGMSLRQEALGQYEAAYEALADTDNLINQFHCLRNSAELRMELGERDIAMKRLQEALDIAHVLGLASEDAMLKQLDQWKRGEP